jgi:hypothetical protein
VGFFLDLDLCCGGDLATTSTARSKRDHASGRNSLAFVFGSFVMQPLSRVRKHALVTFGQDDTMVVRPRVAVKIAECIAAWANIESMLGLFLGLLLHSKAKTTLTMYMALENRAAQLRLLEAAAKAELPELQFDLYIVVMEQYLRPIMLTRDKLAHWRWGYSPDLADDLLLMSPEDALFSHFTALKGATVDIDDNAVFVVTEKYLTELLNRIWIAQGYLSTIVASIAPAELALLQDVPGLERLANQPEIRKSLDRLRAKREKPRAMHQQSPEASDLPEPE